MFILDSLFLSGFRWVLDTVATAADAELNDDTALREQLLAAEMQREMGELSDEEFARLEADLLARIREIKTRREGGSGPIAFSAGAGQESEDPGFSVEATVSGDFHEPAGEPVAFEHHPVGVEEDHGTVIEGTLVPGPTRGAPEKLATRTAKPRRRTKASRRSRRLPRASSSSASQPSRAGVPAGSATTRSRRARRPGGTKIRE
jgi:hypothetical protein